MSRGDAAASTPQGVTIRRYDDPDHDEVVAVHRLALEQIGTYLTDPHWDADLDRITDVYLRDGGEFLVGVYEGRIVAMWALKRTDTSRAQIRRMRVHPDLQRRGIGQEMLRRLEARALELGYRTLHLDTTVQQTAAQRLYQKNGYYETGRTRWGQFDVILYEKVIS